MPLKTVTFRVPQEKLSALDQIAELQQRDRSSLINEAVAQYLSLHSYHRELIEEGLRQDEAGDLLEHAAVRAGAASFSSSRRASAVRASDVPSL